MGGRGSLIPGLAGCRVCIAEGGGRVACYGYGFILVLWVFSFVDTRVLGNVFSYGVESVWFAPLEKSFPVAASTSSRVPTFEIAVTFGA